VTIGELARRTGLRASAIRYYEEIGVLPEPLRVGGQRRYHDDALRRLAVVATAQRAGLSLAEIRTLLQAGPGDRAAVEALRGIAAEGFPR
jgi:MerR family transcriptional regulator, redox-sensitive transcriptional activator SoxR